MMNSGILFMLDRSLRPRVREMAHENSELIILFYRKKLTRSIEDDVYVIRRMI